ncbi:MAG: hypothetical protein IBX52_07720 [Bacterioplanes sp.]|nr:hypothetical protein [Bacterioplanes sp.]
MRWIAMVVSLVLIVVYWHRADVTRSEALVHVAVSMSQPAVGGTYRSESRLLVDALANDLPDKVQLPASLSDVQPHFALQLDEQGNLLITLAVLDLFEFYLSARGEVDDTDVHALLDHFLNQHLSEPALAQAQQLYARYVDYLQAAAELPVYEWQGLSAEQMDWQAVHQQLADIEALRRYYFPHAYDVFFVEDAQHSERLLNQMQFAETVDVDLHDNEQQRLNVLLLQRHGTWPQAEVKTTFSADAQARMTQRQTQRSQWQQRVAQFSQWHQALQHSGISSDEYYVQRDRELAKRFTDSEQYRVKSLLSLW